MQSDQPGHPATARGTDGKHGRGETGGRGTKARRRHAGVAVNAATTAENGSGDAPGHELSYQGGVGAGGVLVLSKEGRPLMPCHPARARELLGRGRAVVSRHMPFTTPPAGNPYRPCLGKPLERLQDAS
ncbi:MULTISPECIES: RRXRR domain-containing protein [unclassified Streptomyces]|uniref:RRXRR domain-containing protein n=1 Tax=unclassified Streptomyces TaxID=2593676 RepID=UPI002379C36A|nr:RRXRR domain-containing protein [Streptomyces sp. TSRI0107]